MDILKIESSRDPILEVVSRFICLHWFFGNLLAMLLEMGSALVFTTDAYQWQSCFRWELCNWYDWKLKPRLQRMSKGLWKNIVLNLYWITNNLNMGVKLSFQLIIQQWTIECIIYILGICLHWSTSFVMTFEYMLSNYIYIYIYIYLKFKTIFYCSLWFHTH